MNAIYRAIHRTLDRLRDAVHDIRNEVENDPKIFRHPGRNAFSTVTRSVKRPFTTLRDHVDLIEEITRNGDEADGDIWCQNLCGQIMRLQKKGKRLNNRLEGLAKQRLHGKKYKRFRKNFILELENIIAVTKRICTQIENEALLDAS